MEIRLPFGGKDRQVDIDSLPGALRVGGIFRCQFPSPLSQKSMEDKIWEGLNHYKKFFDNKKILTVVNDGYRRTPTDLLLPMIWDYVEGGEFIVATGTHRNPSGDELRKIFGPLLDEVEPKLHIHNCYDETSLVDIGKTRLGTPVRLNREVIEADVIIAINSVEPHFLAGFSGGRKSIVPGLASFDTVQANHQFAKDINSSSLYLENNPLHLDLEDAMSFLGDKTILGIQCVTDRAGRIIGLFVGTLNEAFLKACDCAKKFYVVEVPRKFDIVIANCEPPLDVNLYQLQKAQEHGSRMVKDGGVLIVMGACKEGVGSEYFMKLVEFYPTPKEVLEKGINDNSFGIHKLIKTARQLKCFKIYYVTMLEGYLVRKVYFKSFNDVNDALKSALSEIGDNVELAFLEDAGYTVPEVKH
ncbi:MAG: nickel-dependent lactate racemase [Candidatus Zixiibacteriota bacterium]|nr:MAG: nickel-dependent lactate racemase [candidate division Zixibacteria bacterium]